MKTLILAFATSLTWSSAAGAVCPDISGSYRAGDKVFVGYEQTGCQFLKRYYGEQVVDGSISYSFDKQFKNGQPICSTVGACETVTFTTNAVTFDLDFNGSILTDDHGRCSHKKYSLSKDRVGNLVGVFSVFSCADGYKGETTRVFPK